MFESTARNAAVAKGLVEGISEGFSQGFSQGFLQGLIKGERRGRLREGRELVLALGRDRLGEPTPDVAARLESVTDPEQYPILIRRVVAAQSWSELFPA